MDKIMAFLTQYLGSFAITAVVAFCFALMLAGIYILPVLRDYLKKLAVKNFSEKVSVRIKDAIDKLYAIVNHVLEVELATAKVEIIEALKDGKIDQEEVQKILKKVTEEALKLISPEVNTLKNYLTGEALFEYVLKVVSSFAINYAKEKLQVSKEPVPPFSPKEPSR
jgi:uncharacterized membrane protein